MRYTLMVILCILICLGVFTCSISPKTKTTTETITQVNKNNNKYLDTNYYYIKHNNDIVLSINTVKTEKFISEMAKEIEVFWYYYYPLKMKNKEPWPIRDRHRANFKKYSRQLAEVVYYYQHYRTNLGGILPKGKGTYQFFAMMMAKETAVIPTVRGSIGEVGLLQVHGEAQFGWTVQEILDDPRKGIIAGVRWMTSKFKTCKKNISHTNWKQSDWRYPLSIYAAGEGNGRAKRGKCQIISVANKRMKILKRYNKKKV